MEKIESFVNTVSENRYYLSNCFGQYNCRKDLTANTNTIFLLSPQGREYDKEDRILKSHIPSRCRNIDIHNYVCIDDHFEASKRNRNNLMHQFGDCIRRLYSEPVATSDPLNKREGYFLYAYNMSFCGFTPQYVGNGIIFHSKNPQCRTMLSELSCLWLNLAIDSGYSALYSTMDDLEDYELYIDQYYYVDVLVIDKCNEEVTKKTKKMMRQIINTRSNAGLSTSLVITGYASPQSFLDVCKIEYDLKSNPVISI